MKPDLSNKDHAVLMAHAMGVACQIKLRTSKWVNMNANARQELIEAHMRERYMYVDFRIKPDAQ